MKAKDTLLFIELVKKRPKIAWRHAKSRTLKNAIRSYDRNRRTG